MTIFFLIAINSKGIKTTKKIKNQPFVTDEAFSIVPLTVECYAGTKSPGGVRCESCPIGTYQSEIGGTSCNVCPGGTSTIAKGATQCYGVYKVCNCMMSPGGHQQVNILLSSSNFQKLKLYIIITVIMLLDEQSKPTIKLPTYGRFVIMICRASQLIKTLKFPGVET